jgi:hypothetical protein
VDATIVRSITREYRIRTSSPEIAPFLAFIEARPEMQGSTLEPVEIAAEPLAEGFRVRLPTRETQDQTAVAAANRIHETILAGVQDEAPGAPLVHGASLVHEGRRVILVGRKGAGKSTLTLHLLARGFEVEGDEHVVLREGDLIARPRRMRIKPGSLPFVPEFTDAVLNSPAVPDAFGTTVYAVDPAISGRPWRVRAGRADHIVFLAPNHGRRSTLGAVPRDEAFRRFAADCLFPKDKLVALTRLRRLAAEARTWGMLLGGLIEAEDHLRNLLQSGHTAP